MTAFILIAAFAILAGMKLYGFIAWSWWIVSIPVLIPALFIVGAFVLVAVIVSLIPVAFIIFVLAIPIGVIGYFIWKGTEYLADEIDFYLIRRRAKKERVNDRQS